MSKCFDVLVFHFNYLMCGGHFVRLDASILQLLVVLYQINLGVGNHGLVLFAARLRVSFFLAQFISTAIQNVKWKVKKPSHARKTHPHPSVCLRVTAHLLAHKNISLIYAETQSCHRHLSFERSWRSPPASPSCSFPLRSNPSQYVEVFKQKLIISPPARTPEKHEGSCHS